jgi:hypothetical protein
MSLRDQVLDALTDHPGGLTSKELTPLCPSAEDDSSMVGRVIAGLRSEHVIHPGTELREGATVWIFGRGAEADATVNERPVSHPEVSKAAHAIAAMRAPSAAAERAPDRAPKPVTTPSPARQAASQEYPMEKKTVAERAFDAIKAHGPITLEQLAKRVGSTVGSLYTQLPKLRELGVAKHQPNPREVATYAVGKVAKDGLAAGAELGKRAPRAKVQPPKGHGRKASARRASRNGGAPGRHRTPPAPPAPNGDGHGAQFAINEAGELGIEKEGGKLCLDPPEFQRLRDFIERTSPVWQGGK